MIDFVGFDNDLSRRSFVLRFDHEPTLEEVGSVPAGVLEHDSEIDLAEVAVLHALLDVRRELDLPLPPIGPAQDSDRTMAACSPTRFAAKLSAFSVRIAR